ncbi:glycosyltransferase [Pannonibacter phragmitetus]|uniref:glycosyltransferase n=1 Tax=Pannonibacter phragmitetus TaxID=121719 RepID=UPI000B978EBC|nr:glycosyltransferase [Pannonibacter phragmitetus]
MPGKAHLSKSANLTVCIVTHNPNPNVIERTILALNRAICKISTPVFVTIVDNSPCFNPESFNFIKKFTLNFKLKIIKGHGNIGFAKANNIILDEVGQFHLILNPDAEVASDAIEQGLAFLWENEDCVLITPAAWSLNGQRQFLCKRYPAIFDLFLRGFTPSYLRKLFKSRLKRYEMQMETGDSVFWDPLIVSGCFMLVRGDAFKSSGGFCTKFMLYFEDFDLSLRITKFGRIAYVPQVKIIHAGGNAAAKGLWHIWQFSKSAFIFYRLHGFRVF